MPAILPSEGTLAELVHYLGDIPLERIRRDPRPGTATLQDAIHAECCELIEGTLVEKAMGLRESLLAVFLGRVLDEFVTGQNLGAVTGEQGMMQISLDLVRIPDVAYFSWDRFPEGRIPEEPTSLLLVPDLAIEVISRGNTPREMALKRREYFVAGVRQVWMVDPVARTVAVYSDEATFQVLTEDDAIDGGEMLPRFSLAVRNIFARLDRHR